MASDSSSPRTGALRCAIYTRKSSEEGLEQDFNSLDAQREACADYIRSQRSEGWRALPAFYDDGGYSGGTMDRPALIRLLADIRADKVDVVVVYKIDRLTRSLPDFARMVETFDAHKVSFVSVSGANLAIETAPQTRYRRKLLCLAFLAPDIQKRILAGQQPPALTLAKILNSKMPLSWQAQREWILSLR